MNLTNVFLALSLSLSVTALSQPLSEFPDHLIPSLEALYAADDADVDRTDLQTWLEHLQHYLREPLPLNKASAADWEGLGLLDQLQIECLLNYRLDYGPFVEVEELQSTGCISQGLVRVLSVLVSAESGAPLRTDLWRMLRESRQSLMARWSRSLGEDTRFLVDSTSGYARFEGGPDRVFLRFRRSYGSQFSLGFTAEKDPGEALFSGSNAHGFDFLSAHLYMRDVSPLLRTLAVGDFSVNLGQGLIVHSGFGGTKSAMVMQIARTGDVLQRYASVDENRFFRGCGVQLAFSPTVDATVFGSSHRIDASAFAADSVSSLLASGFHREFGERLSENSLRQNVAGGRLAYETEWLRLRANSMVTRFNKVVAPAVKPYNLWYFRGQQLINLSLDYTFRLKGLYMFGEIAQSSNGAMATVNGLLATLGGGLDLALCLRHLDPEYQAPLARAFTENSRAQNETGGYIGLSIKPIRQLTLEGFIDVYRHPWVRYRIDAPSSGREWRLRATLEKRRRYELFAEVRNERKWAGGLRSGKAGEFTGLSPGRLTQLRIHFGIQLSKGVEWRMRMNGAWLKEAAATQQGWQFHQDLIYKPMGKPLHLSARLAWFDTDSYDVRFYNFENGLLYQFSIPAYYGRGWRAYINLRWRGWSPLVLEARWSATKSVRQNPEQNGRSSEDIGAQLTWSF